MSCKEGVRPKVLDALVELSEEQPFDRITVSELCERAHVSRGAFYYHFDGIADVVATLSERVAQLGIDRMGRSLNCFEAYFITTAFFKRYRTLLVNASANCSPDSPREIFYRRRTAVLHETLRMRGIDCDGYTDLMVSSLARSEFSATVDWMRGEYPDMGIVEYCHAMADSVPRGLSNVFDNPPSHESCDELLLDMENSWCLNEDAGQIGGKAPAPRAAGVNPFAVR